MNDTPVPVWARQGKLFSYSGEEKQQHAIGKAIQAQALEILVRGIHPGELNAVTNLIWAAWESGLIAREDVQQFVEHGMEWALNPASRDKAERKILRVVRGLVYVG